MTEAIGLKSIHKDGSRGDKTEQMGKEIGRQDYYCPEDLSWLERKAS